MSPQIYYLVHVFSGFLLLALTFYACASADPKGRKPMLMITGILSLLIIVAGFGLPPSLGWEEMPLWMFLKIIPWLILSSLAGLAYRKPGMRSIWMGIAALCVLAALFLVYTRPFAG